MTKAEIMKVLDCVDDSARITAVHPDGTVVDFNLVYFAKAQPGFRSKDEVFLQETQP